MRDTERDISLKWIKGSQPFKRQSRKMVKHIQTINRRLILWKLLALYKGVYLFINTYKESFI